MTQALVVYDLETSGLSYERDRLLQIGAVAYDYGTLEPIPDGEFLSYLKPENWQDLDYTSRAFQVNGITIDDVKNAPDEKAVWLRFINWVASFNPRRGPKTAPYAGGKNIIGFDMKWVAFLNQKYGVKDPFNNRRVFDLEDDIERWFVACSDLKNQKMDTIREYLGMEVHPHHDALQDSKDEGEVLVRFLKLYRNLKAKRRADGTPVIQFQGAFAR